MAVYSYELSTTSTLKNLEDFTTPIHPPRGRYYEAGEFVDRLDGTVSAVGYPLAVWQFDILTQAMIDALRVICPGYSAEVYLRTRINTGSFAYFTGLMIWPQKQMDARNFLGRYLGLEFQFRRLASYTPPS